MGLLSKLTEKYNCDICGASENKLLMQVLVDGRICNNCFNKLGSGRFSTKYTLQEARQKIEETNELSANITNNQNIEKSTQATQNHSTFFKPFQYDLNTIDGISNIPNKQNILSSFLNGTFNNTILYKLQKKATEYKRSEQPELALACLEKSFEIMLESDYYYGEYADRYVSFLKKYRYFDKAREVAKIIESHNCESYISELEK